MPAGTRQIEKAELTRRSLVAAARHLFVVDGYFQTGTTQIVDAAHVTRGALYHHFADKKDLFRAVFQEVGDEILERHIAAVTAEVPAGGDPWEAMRIGLKAFLRTVVDDVVVQRIVLVDGPAVLGWQEWSDIEGALSRELIEKGIADAIDAGIIDPQPPGAMAHMILGLLNAGALLVANADDRDQALRDTSAALDALMKGLRR